MKAAIVAWLAATSSIASAYAARSAASSDFEEIIAMLDTAAISSDCELGERRMSGELGARTLSYELRKGGVAVAVSLGEAARDAQWHVSRSAQGGVPYWRLSAGASGAGLASLEWTVRDSDRVSTTLDARAEDGRELRCGLESAG